MHCVQGARDQSKFLDRMHLCPFLITCRTGSTCQDTSTHLHSAHLPKKLWLHSGVTLSAKNVSSGFSTAGKLAKKDVILNIAWYADNLSGCKDSDSGAAASNGLRHYRHAIRSLFPPKMTKLQQFAWSEDLKMVDAVTWNCLRATKKETFFWKRART